MDVFEALAEPSRRKILGLLRNSELPAGDVVSGVGLSQSGVSKHLKRLREAGLVSMRVDGQRRLYRFEPEKLDELDAWLEPYRQVCRGRFDVVDRYLEQDEQDGR